MVCVCSSVCEKETLAYTVDLEVNERGKGEKLFETVLLLMTKCP